MTTRHYAFMWMDEQLSMCIHMLEAENQGAAQDAFARFTREELDAEDQSYFALLSSREPMSIDEFYA